MATWLDWNGREILADDRVKIQGNTKAYDGVPTYVINAFGTVIGFARTKVVVHVDGYGDRKFRVPGKGLQVTDTDRPLFRASPSRALAMPVPEPLPVPAGIVMNADERLVAQGAVVRALHAAANRLEAAPVLENPYHLSELAEEVAKLDAKIRMAVLS